MSICEPTRDASVLVSRMAGLVAWGRRLRPVAALRSLGKPRELARNRREYRRLGLRKSPVSSVAHAEVQGRGGERPWLDRDPSEGDIRNAPGFSDLPGEAGEGALRWSERGYMMLEGFYGEELINRINAEIEELLDSGGLHFHARSPRVMNSWRRSPAVAEAVADPRLLGTLGFLMGRRATLFQTISFLIGSQQSAHSDAFHMMTEPPGYLVGVWVALEDIGPEQGPVFYLPGSHRLPYLMSGDLDLPPTRALTVADKGRPYVAKMKQTVDAYEAEPEAFTASKGDVLLWHHNLLHGGSAIERPGVTRKSLIAHFFAADVLAYHEVTERPALLPG